MNFDWTIDDYYYQSSHYCSIEYTLLRLYVRTDDVNVHNFQQKIVTSNCIQPQSLIFQDKIFKQPV